MPASLSPEELAETLSVSRETLVRLRAYVDLLKTWNARINLVSAASLEDVWRRHILDSGQLFKLLPTEARVLVDFGSGAGFPGLVLAILGVPEAHLIESDRRKAEFLREAARVSSTPVTIHVHRIEGVPGFPADVVTARALAPLAQLLEWSTPFLTDRTVCLFLKGAEGPNELTLASRRWIMRTQVLASLTDPTGHILRVEEPRHAPNRPTTRDVNG
jgi:16S rRNA (guanine527-N7)-methyltransferase